MIRAFENMFGTRYFSDDPNVIFVRHPIVAPETFENMYGQEENSHTRRFSNDPNTIFIKTPIVQYGEREPYELTPSEESDLFVPLRGYGYTKGNFENMGRYEFEVPRDYEIHPPDVPIRVDGFYLPKINIPKAIKKLRTFENYDNMMLTHFENMGSFWSKIKKAPGKVWGGTKWVGRKAEPLKWIAPPYAIYKKGGQIKRWFSRRVPGTEEWWKDKLGIDSDTAKIIKWGAVAGALGIGALLVHKAYKKWW